MNTLYTYIFYIINNLAKISKLHLDSCMFTVVDSYSSISHIVKNFYSEVKCEATQCECV